jgi:glycine/D-amino acid oxidase-like deaminating enzyme
VLIVGAGIVGMSAAYFLSTAGWHVRVLEQGVPASGATGAADGAVSVASKKAGPLMTLAVAGARFYETLRASGVLADEFVQRPTYVVATEADELPVLDRHAEQLTTSGVKLRVLGSNERERLLGTVAPSTLAAIEVVGDGHAIGYKVVERLRRIGKFAVERGVAVRGLFQEDGRVAGVSTDQGIERADTVLIAAGGGSAAFLEPSNLLRPRKGQLIVTERTSGGSALPGPLMSCRYLVSKGSQPGAERSDARSFGLVIDPLQTGQYLIGGTREDNADSSTDIDAVRQILTEAVALVPSLAALRIVRVFAGIRTATRDGLPLVGRLPGHDNVWIATGFEGDGICLGPLIGRICQQLICGATIDVDVSALDPQRFSKRAAA